MSPRACSSSSVSCNGLPQLRAFPRRTSVFRHQQLLQNEGPLFNDPIRCTIEVHCFKFSLVREL